MLLISDAIEAEERRQRVGKESTPAGYSDIFLTDEQLDLADRASRVVGSPSLADFCRKAILQEARRILKEEKERSDVPEGPGAFVVSPPVQK